MANKKFAVTVGFTATMEGDSEADVIATAAFDIKYSRTFPGARHLSVAVVHEMESVPGIVEAPYADQVTVHESDGEVEQPPAPVITLLAPDEPLTGEDGSGLPPVSTGMLELTEAYTKPDPNDIPF